MLLTAATDINASHCRLDITLNKHKNTDKLCARQLRKSEN